MSRTSNFFEGINAECRVCVLNDEFAEETHVHTSANSKDITCSICKESKPAKDFSQYARRECAIARCRACSVACLQCHKTCTTARMFATGTNLCWKCYQAPRTCSRCKKQFSTENFDKQHISLYDAKEISFLVCKSCFEEGYRYKYIDAIRRFALCSGGLLPVLCLRSSSGEPLRILSPIRPSIGSAHHQTIYFTSFPCFVPPRSSASSYASLHIVSFMHSPITCSSCRANHFPPYPFLVLPALLFIIGGTPTPRMLAVRIGYAVSQILGVQKLRRGRLQA